MESVKPSNNGVVAEESQLQSEQGAETAGAQEKRADAQQAAVPADPFAPERDRLNKEKAELRDLLQRKQAEFENYRRRVERERSDLFDLAAMDSVKALLPVLDDFERALKAESADKEYARGMEMIYQRLLDTLKKIGVEPIKNDVPVFNPHIHHAVEMVETKDYPDQTIIEEYQPGYYFKGKLLRPALVKVAVNH